MNAKSRLIRSALAALSVLAVVATTAGRVGGAHQAFDHSYQTLREVLRGHLVGTRVDYGSLQRDRVALDAAVQAFGQVTEDELPRWTREQQIAFWINAYNAFTLQAIVDHYPIRRSLFSLFTFAPRNSIRQIRGVWTDLRWRAAGADMTLNEIEHDTLRAEYYEPRIHFAVHCASVSCPPIRPEPFVADRLDRQLILAARDYLATDLGIQVDGTTLRVSSILDWYGEDFVDGYAHLVDANRSERDRAILGVIAQYGPTAASALAQTGTANISFLSYDWSLNDTAAP